MYLMDSWTPRSIVQALSMSKDSIHVKQNADSPADFLFLSIPSFLFKASPFLRFVICSFCPLADSSSSSHQLTKCLPVLILLFYLARSPTTTNFSIIPPCPIRLPPQSSTSTNPPIQDEK